MVDLKEVMNAKTTAEISQVLINVIQETQKISEAQKIPEAQKLSGFKPLTKDQIQEKVVPGIGNANPMMCPLIIIIIIIIILIAAEDAY